MKHFLSQFYDDAGNVGVFCRKFLIHCPISRVGIDGRLTSRSSTTATTFTPKAATNFSSPNTSDLHNNNSNNNIDDDNPESVWEEELGIVIVIRICWTSECRRVKTLKFRIRLRCSSTESSRTSRNLNFQVIFLFSLMEGIMRPLNLSD